MCVGDRAHFSHDSHSLLFHHILHLPDHSRSTLRGMIILLVTKSPTLCQFCGRASLPPLRPLLESDTRPLCCPEASSAAPAPHSAAASGSPAPAPWVENGWGVIEWHGQPYSKTLTGQQLESKKEREKYLQDNLQLTYCTQSAGPCSVPFCCPGWPAQVLTGQ